MLLVGQRLQSGLRLGLHVQDPLHRRIRVGPIRHGPLQGGQQIVPVILGPEGQDLPALRLALPVRRQQAVPEADADLTEFGEALPQLVVLLAAVVRRAMFRQYLTLPRRRRRAAGDDGPALQVQAVDDQFVLRHPHRQHLPDILPGHRVLILPKGDEALGIDRAVDHLGHVVGIGRQRNQMGLFLGVQVERTAVGLPMDPHVGHLGQPPPRAPR